MIDKRKKAVDDKVLGALLTDLSKAFDCRYHDLRSFFSCCKNDTGLCDSNGIRTYNHLVPKQTLKHYARKAFWVKCECLFTK